MPAYANVDGESVIEGTLHVPNVGPWWADVVFEVAPDIEGAVTLNLGALALSGTVDATHDGTFGEQRRTRIVAGGGGWGTLLAALAYHSDGNPSGGGGVAAREVVEDAVRLAGETLGAFAPAADRIGIDYVRQSGPASRVLEDAIGGAPWHVSYSGETIVGERATSDAPDDAYTVLDSNPAERLATIAIDDLSRVGIGSILTTGLDAPLTVRELEVRIGADSSRTAVWGGGTAAGRGRLAGALRRIVDRVTDRALFGRYRYRVVAMSANRVQLQAVVARPGLPDILPISQKPGCAGVHAKLTGGAVVHVIFVEGDRTMPQIVAFAGKDEEGHAPDELDLSVVTLLRLGDDSATSFVALADAVDGHLSTIGTKYDAHTHLETGATTDPPLVASRIGSLSSVAASKVKAK